MTALLPVNTHRCSFPLQSKQGTASVRAFSSHPAEVVVDSGCTLQLGPQLTQVPFTFQPLQAGRRDVLVNFVDVSGSSRRSSIRSSKQQQSLMARSPARTPHAHAHAQAHTRHSKKSRFSSMPTYYWPAMRASALISRASPSCLPHVSCAAAARNRSRKQACVFVAGVCPSKSAPHLQTLRHPPAHRQALQ